MKTHSFTRRKPSLDQLRQFYIYQLLRLTDSKEQDLNKLNTNELQKLERDIYHDKYDSYDKPEYKPMINP